MKLKTIFLVWLAAILVVPLSAQTTFPENGPVDKKGMITAFTHATVHSDYATTLSDATVIIKDQEIISVGKNVVIPKDAIVIDLAGKHIYPAFIELFSNLGIDNPKPGQFDYRPQLESKKNGPYNWNEAIHPEVKGFELFTYNDQKAGALRKNGFGAVVTHQQDGIMRGTGALIALQQERSNTITLNPEAAQFWSFSKGSSRQTYPTSLMGVMALIRQTLLDAQWYSRSINRDHTNISLQALNDSKKLPIIMDAGNYQNILRASEIKKEFGLSPFIVKGNADAYKQLDAIAALRATVIANLNFPKAYDVSDPYAAMQVSLSDLKHWEWAPANLAMLEKKNVPFIITTSDLEKPDMFWSNLRKAVNYGLSEKAALKALTYTPANTIDADTYLGAIKSGYKANFFISDNNIFEDGSKIYDTYVLGNRNSIQPFEPVNIAGEYKLRINNAIYPISIANKGGKLAATAQVIQEADTQKVKLSLEQNASNITFTFQPDDSFIDGLARFNGDVEANGNISGKGQLANTNWVSFALIKQPSNDKPDDKEEEDKEINLPENRMLPMSAYGRTKLPAPKTYLIKNATVWTNESQGVVKNSDVLVSNGKIVRIGKNITSSAATVIDGTGKHLTPGIVDEHSHIAISNGVNEAGQSSSAEVSIGDVVNPDDINVYRQLSGGVTTAQLLHGSANPIGGQSALIKLKYGALPQDFKIKSKDGFIKFALGENVKQANWGDFNTIRYPQTRMGVEQYFFDSFIRAQEYREAWNKYNRSFNKASTPAPRKDLELETLLEILDSKRFISCHSYVQSEINMLMKVADSLNFRVNTFTHILEGYKVADKMKEHGAAGSTFSDWWAYKFEVRDAIPYNASIMHKMGVLTGINSDDAEMARRLNQEAAKTVKYGGVSEEDALKMVTLNPAKMLHLDNRIGSIKPGKDADLVLWSDHPLSIYAKAEKTMIEGALYFDIEEDAELRIQNEKERQRIIQLMLNAKKKGEPVQQPVQKKKELYHCDSIDEAEAQFCNH